MKITGTKREIVEIDVDIERIYSEVVKEVFKSIPDIGYDSFIHEGWWCEDLNSHCNNMQIRKATESEIELNQALNLIGEKIRSITLLRKKKDRI